MAESVLSGLPPEAYDVLTRMVVGGQTRELTELRTALREALYLLDELDPPAPGRRHAAPATPADRT